MQLTKEQIEFLKKQHIHICIPCYGGQCSESLVTGLINFSKYAFAIGMNFSLQTLCNESLVPRARNTLTAQFLANSAATHLMFIDSDISFAPEHIFKLILDNKEIVGGLYPKKTLPPDYVVNVSPDAIDKEGHVKLVDGLIPVSRLGTGFMLIKREVFEKFMVAYPKTHFINNIGLDPALDKYMYAFFDCYITNDSRLEYMSEDWSFCSHCRVIGVECFCDPVLKLNHFGSFMYPGDPAQLYKKMGVDMATTPSLKPKIAMRQDEIADDSARLQVQPDMDALKKYLEEKAAKEQELKNGNIAAK
ncbi:Uncharacterised protein [uncultured archaeon]|nr:Uncharacterised protein [uncultured archaeon]